MKQIRTSINKLGPTRTRILQLLAQLGPCSFATVRDELDLSEGNVWQHARTMQRDGLITADRRLAGKSTLTTYTITPAGRAMLGAAERAA